MLKRTRNSCIIFLSLFFIQGCFIKSKKETTPSYSYYEKETIHVQKHDSLDEIVYLYLNRKRKYFMKDSVLTGPDSTWVKGKFRSVKHWEHGIKVGLDTFGDQITHGRTYYDDSGRIISQIYWSHSNHKLFDISYVNGLKEGKGTYYFDEGQVESTGQFHLDKHVGKWYYYYEYGKLFKIIDFDKDSLERR